MNRVSLQEMLRKEFNMSDANDNDRYIVEGLNIDIKKKTVSLTDEHDKGVDFSLINNPVYDKFKEYDVISIFKRTKLSDEQGVQRDGNPFIYALKNKYGWKFDITDANITKYVRRFLEICKKIKSKYDTIILVPSESTLNRRFMNVISKQVSSTDLITEYFSKVRMEDLVDDDLINWKQIELDYGRNSKDVEEEINRSLRRMKGEYFEAKYMDKKYLGYIKYISVDTDMDIRDKIDNKNILILDDTISSGNTVSQCIDNIITTFDPKSITILTLLSKIQD